jgi:transposase
VKTAEEALKKVGKYGYVSKKLNAVIAASEHNITEVAKIYGISRTTLTSWIKYVKELRLDKLEAPKERKRKSRLNSEQLEEIRHWLELDPNITIKMVRIRIDEKYGIGISKSTVHKAMQGLNFSYITPRPKHYKQDKELIEEFKKKFSKRDKKPS